MATASGKRTLFAGLRGLWPVLMNFPASSPQHFERLSKQFAGIRNIYSKLVPNYYMVYTGANFCYDPV